MCEGQGFVPREKVKDMSSGAERASFQPVELNSPEAVRTVTDGTRSTKECVQGALNQNAPVSSKKRPLTPAQRPRIPVNTPAPRPRTATTKPPVAPEASVQPESLVGKNVNCYAGQFGKRGFTGKYSEIPTGSGRVVEQSDSFITIETPKGRLRLATAVMKIEVVE